MRRSYLGRDGDAAASERKAEGRLRRCCGASCRCCGRRARSSCKARVVAAVLLVLAGKAIMLLMPFAYKAVVDR